MNKRNTVRLVSFCAAAVLVAVGFAVQSRTELNRYRLDIQNTYSRSLNELNAGINNISLILEKASYVTTPRQISNMAARLLSEAETAKSALSQLPASEQELTVLNRFLSQVGNYAMSVSKKMVSGEAADGSFSENITALKDTAKQISETVNGSSITYDNPDSWAKEIGKKLSDTVDPDSLAGALGELEESLTDYPTLVYDGPYSDHILEKEPLMIKNAARVTETQAMERAAEITECKTDRFTRTEQVNGMIPTYRFSGGGIDVAISRSGGYAVYLRKSREIGDYILEYRQALDKAKRYLEKIGLSGFTETYYYTDEGVCVINFAYLDGKTICYTDLIKVGVAMDDGEIMLLETSGYLTNHTDRAFETAAAAPEQAAAIVSPRLKIRETALALIPTDSGGEVRCYEFVCEAEDGQEILIYINAVTLEEEDILILLKSDGGTLTK